ncbi:MAG: DUF1643 domain-containing protein [Geminicoccaceae bacterium]
MSEPTRPVKTRAAQIPIPPQPVIDPHAAARLPGFPSVWNEGRTHRYTLWRWWRPQPQTFAVFIGLNPSAADDQWDDRTVRRCSDFARREGVDALCMCNAFAFMATDPKGLYTHTDPVGADNDLWLQRCSAGAAFTVAAWGAHGRHLGRGAAIAALLPGLRCLSITRAGDPGHPLYLRKDAPLRPWPELSAQ